MTEKRMLIIDAEVAQKIDENRGDMNRSEFLSFLIDSQFKEEAVPHKCVDREEFQQFAQGIKELLRHFLDFFISYGMELGEQPKDQTFEELLKKLQSLSSKKQSPTSK